MNLQIRKLLIILLYFHDSIGALLEFRLICIALVIKFNINNLFNNNIL